MPIRDMTPTVSATCEVWLDARGPSRVCGKPTAYWYPALGGGTMALCDAHAQQHLPHAHAIALKRYDPPAASLPTA